MGDQLNTVGPPPGYPAEHVRDLPVRDGRHMLIRPITPADGPDIDASDGSPEAARSRTVLAAPSKPIPDLADIQMADVFVELAETLDGPLTPGKYLRLVADRCVQLLGVSAAGVLLSDGQANLHVAAASSQRTELLEEFQLHTGQGPGLDCYHTGLPVAVNDIGAAGRWPRFAAGAAEVGFASMHALPMRLRTEVIGSLDLFNTQPGALDDCRLRIGQALADLATIGLLQQRAIHDREVLAEQLSTALNSRVLIEQAKGVLAQRLHLDVADAFTLLRNAARSRNQRISELAQAVVDGTEHTVSAAATTGPLVGPATRSR